MNPFLRTLSAVSLSAGLSSLLVGCAVTAEQGLEKENVSNESAEAALSGSIRDLGEIPASGETRTVKYANPPKYVAYTFHANGGEEVDAWVRGVGDDDAVAWILDASGKQLAFNDDASTSTLDAHLTVKLPATLGTKAKLKLVFRDYWLAKATFTASVRVKPGMFACGVDSDCVKVSRGGCCTAWQSIAVNASRADDYAAANVCTPPYPPCAPPPKGETVDDTVARCDAGTCALGAPPAPACDPAKEPNRRYVASSPAQCMLVKFACEAGTNGFSNACGCGCEQPSDCPSFINCMPGPGVPSCAPERARCPYTPVAY